MRIFALNILDRISCFVGSLYRYIKAALGIEKIAGRYDFSVLKELGIVYIVGLIILPPLIPLNPAIWLLFLIILLTMINLPSIIKEIASE